MKKILVLTLICFTYFNSYSQQNTNTDSDDVETRSERNLQFRKRSFTERLAFGGEMTFYMGASSYINGTVTNISLCPFVGYRLNPDLTIGIGPNYQYWGFRNSFQIVRDHYFGGRIFARHEIGKMFFLHAEYEIYNLETYSTIGGLGRRNVDLASIGGGYKNNFGGDFGYYYVMILFDFLQNVYSQQVYFTAPIIIKAGFIFGK